MEIRPQEKDRDKRGKLFASGEPLLVSFGYRKTTVDEICRAAGMSKRTFYELFADKADYCIQLAMHLAGDMVAYWREQVEDGMSARGKLELFLRQYLQVCREHRVFGVLFAERELLEAIARVCDMFDSTQLYTVLHGILAEGIDSGEFERYDPHGMVMLIYSLLDTMAYLAPSCYASAGILEDEDAAGQVITFILNGMTRYRGAGAEAGS